jgi:hypothetical protein
MIVSITVVTTDELEAVGAGAALSVDGTSPANAVPERAQARATTITMRFIFVFLLD